MEFLKSILSEKTYKDLTEKLGEELVKSISEKTADFNVDIAEEKFIPKAKFDAERNQVKELTAQITARDGQLAELQKSAKGNEELTKQITALQEANTKQSEAHAEALLSRERDFAIETALMKNGAKNTKAVRANLDIEKILYKDGSLSGLDEQIKGLKQSDSYLFNISNGNDEAGGDPSHGGKPKNSTDKNFERFRNLR